MNEQIAGKLFDYGDDRNFAHDDALSRFVRDKSRMMNDLLRDGRGTGYGRLLEPEELFCDRLKIDIRQR